MHTTVHVALGIIIASISSFFFQMNFWTFSVIAICGFAPDFDIVFSKKARDWNHRNLITHSIYMPSIILGIGIIFSISWIIIAAISYISHLSMDLIDWGTDLFHTNKTVGIAFLLKPLSENHTQEEIKTNPHAKWFFLELYFGSKGLKFYETLLCIIMVLMLFIFSPIYWYFIVLYIAAFIFHLVEYLEFKHLSQGGKPRISFFIFHTGDSANQPKTLSTESQGEEK
jgi:hypothetical protein